MSKSIKSVNERRLYDRKKINKPVQKDKNVYPLVYREAFLLNEVNKYGR